MPQAESNARATVQSRVVWLARAALHVSCAYLVAWHVSFVLVFLLRGDTITPDLYLDYLVFLVQPGFVIPSFIQYGAVLLTVAYFVVLSAKRLLPKKSD